MGQRVSHGWTQTFQPDEHPRTDRPPTFDPLFGFEGRGRKIRQPPVTLAEMDRWKLMIEERDYCAGRLIELKKCWDGHTPLSGYFCSDLKHAFHQCEYDEYILRMKEFERERRLLLRQKRKREKLLKEKAETVTANGDGLVVQ